MSDAASWAQMLLLPFVFFAIGVALWLWQALDDLLQAIDEALTKRLG